MAVYIGDYTTDTGLLLAGVVLTVSLVEGVTLLTSRGRSTPTTYEYDADIVPLTFLNEVIIPAQRSKYCTIPDFLVRQRFAKLYISSTTYVRIELPFQPNTLTFNNFMIEAASNFLRVQTLGYEGEFMSREHFQTYRF